MSERSERIINTALAPRSGALSGTATEEPAR
jgi:hypothetical protein